MRHERPRPLSRTLDTHMIEDTTHNHTNTRAQIHVTTKAPHEHADIWRWRGIPGVFSTAQIYCHSHLYEASHLNNVACADKLVNPADNAEKSSSSSCFLLSPEEDVAISSQVFTAKSIISPWQETGNRVSERSVCAGGKKPLIFMGIDHLSKT